MGTELALDIFIPQQAHIRRQFLTVNAEQASVEVERREEGDPFGCQAGFGAERRGSR